LAGIQQALHVGKYVRTDEGEVVQTIEGCVRMSQRQRRLGNIDTEDGCGARPRSMETKASCVAKSVEHATANGKPRNGPAIFTLIQVETSLLSLGNIY